jgi:hypothetical protein
MELVIMLFMPFILVPLLLLLFVARTPLSWLPGALVIAAACVMFGMIEPVDAHAMPIDALGNGLLTLGAIGLSVYGVILLAVGAKLYRKAQPQPERQPPITLPVARAIVGVDND